MPKVKQITVTCENRPGTLASLANILGKSKVNILAFNASSAGAMGYVQLIVDNVARAEKALRGKGFACYEETVIHLTLPNRPGALATYAGRLATKDINIGAGYQTTVEGSDKASIVLAVSRPAAAAKIR